MPTAEFAAPPGGFRPRPQSPGRVQRSERECMAPGGCVRRLQFSSNHHPSDNFVTADGGAVVARIQLAIYMHRMAMGAGQRNRTTSPAMSQRLTLNYFRRRGRCGGVVGKQEDLT